MDKYRGKANKSGSAAPGIQKLHLLCNVYTSTSTANHLLDLAGWTARSALLEGHFLEPAAGTGAILLPAINRLLRSMRSRNQSFSDPRFESCIRAYEISGAAASAARTRLIAELRSVGLSRVRAIELSRKWVVTRDFLTLRPQSQYSTIVTNPPYVRWSKVPDVLAKNYQSLGFHPANLSILFAQKCCELLREEGLLAILSSDRWLTSIHGRLARLQFIDKLRAVGHIVTTAANSYQRTVYAYPVISLFEKREVNANSAFVVRPASTNLQIAKAVRSIRKAQALKRSPDRPVSGHRQVALVFGSRRERTLFRKLSGRYPTLVQVGCEIRVGLAVGGKDVFVVPKTDEHLEKTILVPFVDTADISANGNVGHRSSIICTYDSVSGLIPLGKFPRARAHLEFHQERLVKRACVRRREQWYRTIDVLDRDRLSQPKLLVVGVGRTPRIGIQNGGMQHSNGLYSITSAKWPLPALRTYLMSGMLELTATCMGQRYGGGSLRFTSAVLDKVPIPHWCDVPQDVQKRLAKGHFTPERAKSLVKQFVTSS